MNFKLERIFILLAIVYFLNQNHYKPQSIPSGVGEIFYYRINIYVTVTYLKAVFDSCDWPSLWLFPWLAGMPNIIVNMLTKLYDGRELCQAE